jgi:hypothetical protein
LIIVELGPLASKSSSQFLEARFGRIDLADNQVDHAVEELVLVTHEYTQPKGERTR